MARLTLTPTQNVNKLNTHRASASEGEAAIRLLEEQGFPIKRVAHGQAHLRCPFHEGPGQVEPRKSANFYLNSDTGLYFCMSASCGERGNLRLLEKFFGVDGNDGYTASFQTREDKLRVFEALLTEPLRRPFYDHGLTDQTIERFRLGYEPQHTETIDGREVTIGARYVIPYLEGRRPKLFRYYQPYGDPKWKYTWEPEAEACLYNAQDAVGDADGIVFNTEGELKVMLLVQLGYAATGVPGAGQWREEWQAAFTHARQILFLYDNDNPFFHNYDKPDKGYRCQKCAGRGLDRCGGHNPGQDAAVVRVEQVGWRARNVVLPLPDDQTRKTDINEYFVRDGHSNAEFAELALNRRPNEYKVASLSEITASPPEAATFLVDQGILPRSGRLLIAGKPKIGKEQVTSTPVLTPTGWAKLGEIRPGDYVVSVDGLPTEVTHVHPQGVKPIYRVTMSDGSSTKCGLEHLWTIQTHNDREHAKRDGRPRWRTVTTADIKSLLDQGRTRDTYIPMVAPVQYAPQITELPLDPYGLGLLLGDGSITHSTPTFCKPDPELHDALAKAFPEADIHLLDAERGISSVTVPGGVNTITRSLQALHIHGCRSWEKFVPELYLRASVDDRLAILQGLLDTDGWVQRNPLGNTSAYFGTSSERLKDGVVDLVESLGGMTRVQHKPAPKFQNDGVGRPAWSIRVRLPREFEPFRLTRKLQEWRSGRTSKETEPVRKIVSVEYVEDDEAVCITVDNPDGLYVTERFIVTHNSLLVDNLALSLAAGIPFLGRFPVDHPTRVLLLDRELSKWSLFKRLHELIEHRPGYRAAMDNLLVDHDHLIRLDQKNAFEVLVALVEQNGAEVIVLDTAYKFFAGDVESSTSLMKGFEVLDKLIHHTEAAVVMTHHMRKGMAARGKENTDVADPDSVAGSFLWTGWPNATILLNFLDRSVENPYNAVATFTAFRDHAAPDPLALYRGRESIAYTAITDYSHTDQGPQPGSRPVQIKPTTEAVANLLLELCPTPEEDFIYIAAARFGVSPPTIKPYYLDALSSGAFVKARTKPFIVSFVDPEQAEQSWESEHGLPERPLFEMGQP